MVCQLRNLARMRAAIARSPQRQHLDGDEPMENAVAGQVHRAECTLPEKPNDLVVATQVLGEARLNGRNRAFRHSPLPAEKVRLPP